MQRIKKGSLLFMMLSVPVMAVFMYVWSAGPPDARAFPGPVTQCNTCHNIWAGGSSSQGHALHLALVASNCNVCHATVGDTPLTSRCGECHVVPGVALHHNATGTTSCVGCHPGTAVPENTAVPGYANTALLPCTDGLDNDGDLALDGADSDCGTTPPPTGTEICTDGIDNDGDGLIDSADPDCATTPPPTGTEICTDGIDNDGDGLIDSADPDCATTPPPTSCPSVPADHTIKIRESMHKPGLKQPFANGCTSCHGNDLRGSDTAPSCLKCHGAKWESCDREGRGFGWKNGHNKDKGNKGNSNNSSNSSSNNNSSNNSSNNNNNSNNSNKSNSMTNYQNKR